MLAEKLMGKFAETYILFVWALLYLIVRTLGMTSTSTADFRNATVTLFFL